MWSPQRIRAKLRSESKQLAKGPVRSLLLMVFCNGGSRFYSIGDSHCETLIEWPGAKTGHVGPVTAFLAGRYGELASLIAGKAFGPFGRWNTSLLCRLLIRPGDSVLLFFGEIDVRTHFHSRWKEHGDAGELARFLAQRLAAEARSLAYATGATVGISRVAPPVENLVDKDFPTRGEISDRLLWSRALNQEFDRACSRFGLVFVDAYSSYSDDRGLLDNTLSDGKVHVRPDAAEAMIEECRRLFSLQ